MKTLKDFADKFIGCNIESAMRVPIPDELRRLDKPLYGIRDTVIRTILFMVTQTPQYPHLNDIDLAYIIQVRFYESYATVHELFGQQLSLREPFKISENEFKIIEKAYLNIDEKYSDKTELENAANLCKLPILVNFGALKNLAFIDDTEDLVSPLYIFLYDLLVGSNYEDGRIIVNEFMLSDTAKIEEILRYFKENSLPNQFDRNINITQFTSAIRLICDELKLKPSIVKDRVVYFDDKECKDLDENTLEIFVMSKLNLLFSKKIHPLSSAESSTSFLDMNLSSTATASTKDPSKNSELQELFDLKLKLVLDRVQHSKSI